MKIEIKFKGNFDDRTKMRLRKLIHSTKKVLNDFERGTNQIMVNFRDYKPYHSYGICYQSKNTIGLRPWRGEEPERILRTWFHEFGHLVWRNTQSQIKADAVAEYLETEYKGR